MKKSVIITIAALLVVGYFVFRSAKKAVVNTNTTSALDEIAKTQ